MIVVGIFAQASVRAPVLMKNAFYHLAHIITIGQK